MPIPPKGSIPGRKPRGRSGCDAGLVSLLGGLSGLLEGLLKGLGETLESVQNLNLEDLEKLAEAQGNEEVKNNIKELKEKLGKEGRLDLKKLIDLAAKQGTVRTGIRGSVLGKSFGGGLPLERRGTQETKFDVRGTRSKKTTEQKTRPEKVEMQELEIEVYQERNYIRAVGEMPGVEEENIRCEVKEEGRVLRISAEGRKKYEKEISLPAQVSQKVNWRYRNGILEITLTKKSGG